MKKYLVIIITIILLTACHNITLTKEDFINIGNYNGYIIENNTEEYKNYNYVNDVYYAINRDNAYLIEFLEIKDDDYAKRFYNLNKNIIMEYKKENTYTKEQNMNNYNLYHLENDENYMLIIRCNNNIIYINAPINYILEIEDFLEELNLIY